MMYANCCLVPEVPASCWPSYDILLGAIYLSTDIYSLALPAASAWGTFVRATRLCQDHPCESHASLNGHATLAGNDPSRVARIALQVRALATSCHAMFLAVSGAEIYSPYVGDSEKAIRDVFKRARACAPSIVFLDEVDALVGKRGPALTGNSVAERVLSTVLNEMDGVESAGEVVVVAATNRLESLDSAFLRPGRIDRKIYIGLPVRPSTVPPRKKASFLLFVLPPRPHPVDTSCQSLLQGCGGPTRNSWSPYG